LTREHDRDAVEKQLRELLAEDWRALKAQVKKAVWAALAVRDESAPVVTDRKGQPEPDPDLRDFENVPLVEDVTAYLEREVLAWAPDAWVDDSKTKIGYEIPFTRHFHVYSAPRALEEIDADIEAVEGDILALLREVTT
jgi:type I restriction enzyme M protein